MKYRIRKIIQEEGTEHFIQTSEIMSRLNNLPVIKINDTDECYYNDKHDMDKETLHLISFKGEFLKPCPGTNNYICCGYNILNIGTNCPLDCSYCILQAYFNKPSLRVFVNLENELVKIGEIIDKYPKKVFRIGTGEFTDSLALDEIHHFSNLLAEFVKQRKNVIIEYKTKTTEIKRLFDIKKKERIVISWSLNSPYIVTHEEHGAPSIKQRLIAAKACQDEGFIIGFHFDPLVMHLNWKEQYFKTIEMMAKYLKPDKILWISMGCLRFLPSLKQIILKRHPDSILLNSEFIQGFDGKSRYFKPIRIEMYSYMANLLKKWSGVDLGLYLCMESDEVWRKSLGWSPLNSDGLSDYLDRRVKSFWHFEYK